MNKQLCKSPSFDGDLTLDFQVIKLIPEFPFAGFPKSTMQTPGLARKWDVASGICKAPEKKGWLIKGSLNENVLLHLTVCFSAAFFFFENYTLSEACSCWHIIPFLDSAELIFELISDFSAVLFQLWPSATACLSKLCPSLYASNPFRFFFPPPHP